MAKVNNAVELKDWILRSLGAPQNQIEVTEEQVYDAIDEAISLFIEYHYDGCQQNVVICKVNEDLAAQKAITLDNVFSVNKVMHSDRVNQGNSSLTAGFWRLFYGTGNVGYAHGTRSISGLWSEINGFSLVSYQLWQQFQSEFNDMLNPETRFVFNSLTKELKILDSLPVDSILAFEVYTPIGVKIEDSKGVPGGTAYNHVHFEDPSQPQFIGGETQDDVENYFDQRIFDHRWIKEFSRAMTKRTWGEVLGKFEQVRLPGGATVNGSRLYDQAIGDMERLREELDMLDEPLGIHIG